MRPRTLVIHKANGEIVDIYYDDPAMVCVLIDEDAVDDVDGDDGKIGELFVSPVADMAAQYDADTLARVESCAADATNGSGEWKDTAACEYTDCQQPGVERLPNGEWLCDDHKNAGRR